MAVPGVLRDARLAQAFLVLFVLLVGVQALLSYQQARSHANAWAVARSEAERSGGMVLDSEPSGARAQLLRPPAPPVDLGITPLVMDLAPLLKTMGNGASRPRVALGRLGYTGDWAVPSGFRSSENVPLAATLSLLSPLLFRVPLMLPALLCLALSAVIKRRGAQLQQDLAEAAPAIAYVGEEGLIGPYRLLKLLGKGAVAEVYLGQATDGGGSSPPVAVKIVQDHLSADPQFRLRFEREITIVKGLDHPNIVRVLDSGEDAGRLFMTMEYVAGTSLRERMVAAKKPVSPRQAVSLVLPVAAALAHAHERGVVHRDLKPENILLGQDGIPKVSDFGMARAEESETITATGMMLGTPAYMAPEQVSSPRTKPQADIYSLGCILYELLTGTLPFTGTFEQIVFGRVSKDPPSVRSLRADVPAPLDDLVMRMLRRRPEDRPVSCSEIHVALSAMLCSLR